MQCSQSIFFDEYKVNLDNIGKGFALRKNYNEKEKHVEKPSQSIWITEERFCFWTKITAEQNNNTDKIFLYGCVCYTA